MWWLYDYLADLYWVIYAMPIYMSWQIIINLRAASIFYSCLKIQFLSSPFSIFKILFLRHAVMIHENNSHVRLQRFVYNQWDWNFMILSSGLISNYVRSWLVKLYFHSWNFSWFDSNSWMKPHFFFWWFFKKSLNLSAR